MSKTAVYINDTYPRPLAPNSWQKICARNLRAYFGRLDCDLIFLGEDNPHIALLEEYRRRHAGIIEEQQAVDEWWYAVLRKHARLAEFLNSDYERALFCDLDTLAVSNDDIFEYLDSDALYLLHAPRGSSFWSTFPFAQDFFEFKYNSNGAALPRIKTLENYSFVSTQFVFFGRATAAAFQHFLSANGLDPFEEEHYKALLRFSAAHARPGGYGLIMDEGLLEMYVNAEYTGRLESFPKVTTVRFLGLKNQQPILVMPDLVPADRHAETKEQLIALGEQLWST